MVLHSTVGPSSALHKAALQAFLEEYYSAAPVCAEHSTTTLCCAPRSTILHIPLMLLCTAMALPCVLPGVLHYMPTVAQHRITE